ncbi:cysteine--tRNA ligase-like protein [Bordetella hinzii 5132]|nr:cysteine--tRNA ligase-like protein [Bordetella hinzii 5132]
MLHIYNTLSRTKEAFKPAHAGEVRMYVCGMTVYDYCHLGHARMLVSFDVVQRWLRASGYAVDYVRNITDIDDKIIRRAVETGRRMHEVTEYFIDAMHADERALGVLRPDQEPRATQYVGEMLDIIGRLEQNGLAYQAGDGDVNYSVRGFPGYGKLSGKTLDDLRAGERVAVDSSKRDPLDFVLWKAAKAEEPPETKWESPYGFGRPGWHIECSAMSKSLLGLPLDIHGGGPDLKFPHHENEIAQTEGAFGGTLANVWMHCGPLMVDADKMSKSLGNSAPSARPSRRARPRATGPSMTSIRARRRCCAFSSCATITAARRTTPPTIWSTPRIPWTVSTRPCRTSRPTAPASTGTKPRRRPSRPRWTMISTAPGPSPRCSSWRARPIASAMAAPPGN